ncbi:DUF3322 domain-containing protein [Endozoicomonas arenosclerae]|uniref:DUF3322 domain-containing protein n=1 Tax=Endozoicomonas arenosclerae TaxID=1633495 RepID=UPI000AAFD4CC|nr:Wadjet anti-phage system protein JetD domain-containing protein [Endozoicomonas arenosclerae]
MNWGVTVEAARKQLQEKEWDRWDRLRKHLLDPGSIRISLKPPVGKQALADISRFHQYIKQWQEWHPPEQVEWETRDYHKIGQHRIPVALTLPNLQSLFNALGPEAIKRSRSWEKLFKPFLGINPELKNVLIKHLRMLESMPEDEIESLARVLPQIKKGMGKGFYSRALPISGINTKFIEQNATIIRNFLEVMHTETIQDLYQWLDCNETPSGWLIIRPLCPQTQTEMMGLPILKLSTDVLRNTSMPGTHTLVVENEQTGFALPQLTNTVAVIGGGKNVSWMDAHWLKEKSVAYWGDIDTWGLSILSDARSMMPSLSALMMDGKTYETGLKRASHENQPVKRMPENLTPEEKILFNQLLNAKQGKTRLEQEFLDQDYIFRNLTDWKAHS